MQNIQTVLDTAQIEARRLGVPAIIHAVVTTDGEGQMNLAVISTIDDKTLAFDLLGWLAHVMADMERQRRAAGN